MYQSLLDQLKAEIKTARLKAVLAANSQLLILYWKIGNAILQQKEAEGWGTKIIERLSADLRKEFPDMKGISPRNLSYMRKFADAYPEFLILQVPLAKLDLPANQINEIVPSIKQEELAQITWYHHITLLDKIKDPTERLYYIHKSIENGWSRDVMVHQIELNHYNRQGNATTNFKATLPQPQSDLAIQAFKDPYIFDFLSLTDKHLEKDLEKGLTENITKFLLELGKGFAFVGKQYHIEVSGEDFFLDLLFYHVKLHCYVVIELKTTRFQPEFTGKLNFYLSAVDSQLKSDNDNPTIGILICKEKNKVMAEYALRDIHKPIGVSEYQLTTNLPEDLKSSLPTIEDIENEVENEN